MNFSKFQAFALLEKKKNKKRGGREGGEGQVEVEYNGSR